MAVELIPGTSLPITAPGMAAQPEGRGDVILTHDRHSHEMVDREQPDDLTVMQHRIVEAALRAYDRGRHRCEVVSNAQSIVTDGTTGNAVLQLYLAPAGAEVDVTNVTVDVPGSTTINPTAPYANASSWAYLAVAGPSTSPTNPATTGIRMGMVAFAPTSSAGPILPGQWTFSDSQAPVMFGGEALYFVLVGGSVAALQKISLQVSYRLNLRTPL